MIALPSIAFGGFSGSAKGVTARQVGGRSILSLKCWPMGEATNAQVARRTSMSKITKSWKMLSEEQMRGWDRLAEHTTGQSVFGQAAQMSGLNLYIRLNVSRTMAWESILADAPEQLVCLPNVAYRALWVTPRNVVIKGITHETGYKLVVKMSAGQSAGVSNAWSKTVILSPGMEDDWGDADMTYLYFKTIGVKPAVGEKVFMEMYWLDPETGFVGQSTFDSKVCESEADAAAEGYVRRNKVTMADVKEDSHVTECDVDFSTGAPVISFDAVCLGHSNVASSYAYLEDDIPEDCVGTSMALGRGLTNAQILAWNKLALSQEAKSVLGTKGKISGSNLFTRLNYWIVACGGSALNTPPTLVGVETPGECEITCTGSAFTFKLKTVPADVTNLKLVIEATEGQSNGVSRAYSKAAQIKLVSNPSTTAVDIKSDYEAKNGVLGAGAPKVFFRYYFVNSATGEKSGIMLADAIWTAGE